MEYDLIIIGAGWAGFNAAIRARELGLKVALVEQEQIGGTCLNRGCIPTKSLVQSAKVYSLIKKADSFGISAPCPKVNFSKIQERKDKIILALRNAMQFSLKGVDFINAQAEILSSTEVKLGERIAKTRFILIAAGSRPIELKALKFDGKKIISSDELVNLKELPESLLVIGGGVIGCEFASLFSCFGANVTIIEKMNQLIPGFDKEIANKLGNIFKKKGIKVNTGSEVVPADLEGYNLVLLCVGRMPSLEKLGLAKLPLELDRGRIIVDEYLKTSIPNVYAAGDCTGDFMLAHYAAYQGRVAAENIAHPEKPLGVDKTTVPSCIFTDPEIAAVGLSEEEARNKSIELEINKFDFLGSGMARILDETEGFIKIISDKNTGLILGASIIGPKATELIGILTLALSSHLKASHIRSTLFAHPTLSESISDAL
jgi:dihydrolipoamide dehydrogenase